MDEDSWLPHLLHIGVSASRTRRSPTCRRCGLSLCSHCALEAGRSVQGTGETDSIALLSFSVVSDLPRVSFSLSLSNTLLISSPLAMILTFVRVARAQLLLPHCSLRLAVKCMCVYVCFACFMCACVCGVASPSQRKVKLCNTTACCYGKI